MPASPSIKVILLSVLAVAMKPGSNVNTFRSLFKFAILMTSGPRVPEIESSWIDLPEARFFSSYFVLMRFSDEGCVDSFETAQPCMAVLRNQGRTARGAQLVARALRAHRSARGACAARAFAKRSTNQAFGAAAAYLLRNLSTRPPVSTTFCLPV